MTRVVRLFAAIAVVLGAGLLVPNESRAATIQTGWWWKANTGTQPEPPAVPVVPAPQVTLPAEPPAPPAPPNAEGGLQVAALPDGAFAVAAVRVDAKLTSLTLRVAPNGDANGMQAKLVACAAATSWEPVAGGQWAKKPVVACDVINGGGSVAGIRSDDGLTWTFPVAPIAGDDTTDVVIVPLADSELAAGFAAPFQIVFAIPTANDIVLAPVSDSTGEEQPTDESVDSADELFSDPAAYDELTGLGAPNSGAAPVVRPALDERDQAPILPAFAARERDSGSQLLGALFVLAGLAGFMWASRQPTPPIVSMVRGGRAIPGEAPVLGGLGRFSGVRSGKPPSLQ